MSNPLVKTEFSLVIWLQSPTEITPCVCWELLGLALLKIIKAILPSYQEQGTPGQRRNFRKEVQLQKPTVPQPEAGQHGNEALKTTVIFMSFLGPSARDTVYHPAKPNAPLITDIRINIVLGLLWELLGSQCEGCNLTIWEKLPDQSDGIKSLIYFSTQVSVSSRKKPALWHQFPSFAEWSRKKKKN